MKVPAIFAAALCATPVFAAGLAAIPFKTLAGKETSLAEFKGKVVLVVNTASKCGLTPQYEALEAIHKKFGPKGFTVIAFPCNDFGAQEPGTADEIRGFCQTKYQVSFPLMEKIHVKGPDRHALYTALTGKDGAFPGDVKWNFGKFLIGRDGKALARFEPTEKPDSPTVAAAIEKALSAP